MLDKLKASLRDVVLAALAAFVGAVSVLFAEGVDLALVKAVVIGAAWAAVRAGLGVLAAKLTGGE